MMFCRKGQLKNHNTAMFFRQILPFCPVLPLYRYGYPQILLAKNIGIFPSNITDFAPYYHGTGKKTLNICSEVIHYVLSTFYSREVDNNKATSFPDVPLMFFDNADKRCCLEI